MKSQFARCGSLMRAADDDGFSRVRSANRPRMPGSPAQTNSLPAAAPSWRQCCESYGLWSRLVGFKASPSSRALGATGEVCQAGTIH
jgi:hypothetical protein